MVQSPVLWVVYIPAPSISPVGRGGEERVTASPSACLSLPSAPKAAYWLCNMDRAPLGPGTEHTIFSNCKWWPCLCLSLDTSSFFSDFQRNSSDKIAPKCWSLEPGIIRVCFLEERWGSALPEVGECAPT